MMQPRATAPRFLAFAVFGLVVACGGGGSGGNGALNITSTTASDGVIGRAYNATITATGGQGEKTFAITSGTLPDGLSMSDSGVISGTPAGPAGTSNFTVQVSDSANTPATDSQALSIDIVELGRNDEIADATALPGDGAYAASISPSGDPSTNFEPDEDYYAITTTAASDITIDINAQVNGSPLDTVVEVVNAAGVRLNTCGAPAYASVCAHDDEDPGVARDSFLELRVNGPTTFYIHVVDWASNARPDMLYDLVISGVE